MKTLNPMSSLLRFLGYVLTGRINFPRECLGQTVVMSDGQKFKIFKHAKLNCPPGKEREPLAIFQVRFHVANMTPRQNKMFATIPIPFFVGLPGFRSKFWMLNEETGDFQGIYEWDTINDAENYAKSYAVRFMTGRSVPGTVTWKIIPKSPGWRAQLYAKQ